MFVFETKTEVSPLPPTPAPPSPLIKYLEGILIFILW